MTPDPAHKTHPAFPAKANELLFLEQFVNVLQQINRGQRLEDILEGLFASFSELLPYDRISFSLVDQKAYTVNVLWQRSRYSDVKLSKGYVSNLKGSSLEKVLLSGDPRIIRDLQQYSKEHPDSEATKLMLEEEIRSCLVCPLTHGDAPIGFLVFASRMQDIYKPEHVDAFRWLAEPLTLALDKAQLYERLIKLNDEKNLLLGVAAHDLRSPIAQLQTMGELLSSDTLPDSERKEIAGLIINRAQSMLTLLHDVLDLTAIQAGRLPLRSELVVLEPFCQSIMKGIEPLARAKKILFKFEAQSDLKAMADPTRLAQVIDNLLTNAIKYSPPHSTITVTLKAQGRSWELAVRDEGIGITTKDISQLFKPFTKAASAPTAGEAQFGLGLAIVKKIVEAHGGEVEVESAAGKGSIFKIRLPQLVA